jgi:hypothetical protein
MKEINLFNKSGNQAAKTTSSWARHEIIKGK